jgi:outer membrane murein-binding lipoprotein Lpp
VRSVPALLLPAIAGVLLLAGCAGPPPVDEAALSAWEKRQMAIDSDRDLGAMYAQESAGQSATGNDDEIDRGVTITFAHPETVDHLEFSCFGDGHMSGSVTVVSGGTSRNHITEAMPCSDGEQHIGLRRNWRADVDSISFNGFDSDRDSAWYVRVIGSD